MSKRKNLTTKQRIELFAARKGVCALCNLKIMHKAWDVEHRLALALGGTNDFRNLDVVHVECHRLKTKRDVRDIAKRTRIQAQKIGAKRARNPMPFGRRSPWKKKFSGEIVPR